MQRFKVPVADVNVSPSASGAKSFVKGVVGFSLLFAMIGSAAWLFRKAKSATGIEAGSGFSVEGDF